MNYKQYSVEDFVLDEAFRKWVFDPDKDSQIFWIQWLYEHPEKSKTIAQAVELLSQIPVQQDRLSEQQLSSIRQAIEKGIDVWEETKREQVKPEKVIPISSYAMTQRTLETPLFKKPNKTYYYKIAASIVFVLGMLYLIYHEVAHNNPQPEIVYEQIVKESPKGQKLTVFLSDGSQVILNAGSKITYMKPFQPNLREVMLEGEAFITVAKDSLRPFQVVSGELTTIALGTSFNITAYPKDDYIQVSLTSGKVKVDYQQATGEQKPEVHYLVPGEQLAYNRARQIFTKETFNADKVLAWKEGIIDLENADQATVVKTLERWYGVQVALEGKSATEWNLTAKFNNQSLKSVLTSLSYTMDFTFEIKEGHVLIKYS